MDLEKLRQEIDAIDGEIIGRLNARVRLASEIGRIKKENGQEIYVPGREEEVFAKLNEINEGPLEEKAIRSIYREIISAAIALEKPILVAYLGPEATYTQQAAMKNFGASVKYQPLSGIGDVFSAVERGDADYGVVPRENSTEGAVEETLDLLVKTDLKIIAQIHLEISLCLISKSPLEDIASVHSKDKALGQCRQWLNRNLAGVSRVEAASTSQAVKFAGENPGTAAIASRLAAELYNVPIIAEGIEDRRENFTRFFVIGKNVPEHSGSEFPEKTSFVFSIKDEPGALINALEPFSARGLNLSKIESRPSKTKLWDYYFFIDVLGNQKDPVLQAAVEELEKSCSMVKWLGSYPDTDV